MKKSYLAVALIVALALSTGFAFADEPEKTPENQACSEQANGPKKFDPKAVVQFKKDTLEQRKKLAGSMAAMGAVMKQESPDADKARALAEEIFGLREALEAKALESGLPPFVADVGPGFGPKGKGPGFGPQGKGPGFGPQGMGPGFGPQGKGPGFGPQGKGPGFGPQSMGPGCCPQGMGPGFGPQGKGPGFGPQGMGPGCGPQGMGQGFGPQGKGPGFGPQGKCPGFGPQGMGPGQGCQAQ